jgi:gamma-glutamylcyclotransferase (GGCT)/AIG2-like uncharacterized protein YtfP
MRRVFVYGTLLRGLRNHHLLAGATFAGPARTERRYTLYDMGGYPALVEGGATSVTGEIWEVDEATLAALDRLEQHPTWYERRPLHLIGHIAVEGYLMPRTAVAGRPRVASGDWRAHQSRRTA